MKILGFMVVFIFIGFIIGKILKQEGVAILSIITISVLWSFTFGPWAVATFVELLIGYGLAKNNSSTLV